MASDVDEDILRRSSHLDELDEQALAEFVEACRARTLITGDALWKVGESGESAYVILSGEVELVWRVQPDGREEEQFTQPGTILGLPHLIHPWAHESSAYPLETAEVLRLDRPAFEEMFEAQHPAAYRLVDAVAEELVDEVRDANCRLQDVFGHPAETLRTLRRRAHDSTRR
jgi:CRP/FNR family transcriptional regulator